MQTDMATKKPRAYIAAADVLRVVCIFLVAWYHIWQQSWLNPGFRVGSVYVNLQQFVRNGYIMVDVLLVLSGFLLALPYAKARLGRGERPTAKYFYVNRFWRIVPSYVLAVLLCLFLWALPQGGYATPGAMVKDLVTHLTFTHNFSVDTYHSTQLLVVLWTVAVEVQFYILFPLIVVFYEERPGLTCLVMTLLAVCVRVWVWQLPSSLMWVNQLPCMLDLFACGMGAAWIYTRLSEQDLRPGVRRALAAAALLALCLMFQIQYSQDISTQETIRHCQLLWRLPLGLLAGAFLVCGGLAPAGLSRALGNPVTRFLAAISYNLYIWHQFIALRLKDWHIPAYTAELPNQAGEQPWQTRYTLLCFLAAIAVGAVFTYLWEKPIARWARQKKLPAKNAPL